MLIILNILNFNNFQFNNISFIIVQSYVHFYIQKDIFITINHKISNQINLYTYFLPKYYYKHIINHKIIHIIYYCQMLYIHFVNMIFDIYFLILNLLNKQINIKKYINYPIKTYLNHYIFMYLKYNMLFNFQLKILIIHNLTNINQYYIIR